MGDAQPLPLKEGELAGVNRAAGQQFAVFPGKGAAEQQLAEIVEQAGQIGLGWLRVLDQARQRGGDHRRQQRVMPEPGQGKFRRFLESPEDLVDRDRHGDIPDGIGAEEDDRLAGVAERRAAAEEGRVGKLQDPGADGGVAGDDLGNPGEIGFAVVAGGDQLDQGLGQGRQAGQVEDRFQFGLLHRRWREEGFAEKRFVSYV